jgi:hypothetical protein
MGLHPFDEAKTRLHLLLQVRKYNERRFCMLRGRVSKQITDGSKTALINVIGFIYVSLGSSTGQFHDNLGSRRACAFSDAGFSGQNGDPSCRVSYRRATLCCAFCGRKDSVQRIFIKKCLLFTVGSVCHVKRFITGWQMFR